MQHGEACDDGNTSGDDFCSGDCSILVEAQGRVELSTFALNGAPIVEGKIPLVYHSPVTPRPCGTYVAVAESSNDGDVVGVLPLLCAPDQRRFLLALFFHRPVGSAAFGLLTSSSLVEVDASDKELESWDIVGDIFDESAPPAARLTRVSSGATITSAGGTISIEAKSAKGRTIAMRGSFSFAKVSKPAKP